MSGVTKFTRATVDIYFPKGEVKCALCPLLQTYSRNQCMRTGELIPDTKGIGGWCPLKIEEGDENNGEIQASDR